MFLKGGGIMNNKRIKMIKLRNDQSRIEVAQKLSITPQMLGAIERGDRTPSLELAKKIAELYKTTIDDLFFN
ncbi:PbsX family transcriptional regulator [Bacillus thuringiensis HD-789]|uniref:PbsX family transcriptional regulator n=3 Tax=Bacillus thuringiensis TaxID=1428 RepID=A0A9W3JQ40_BACTU|nr:PbsX family transcriptional regulator [Bacillus thuringiensis HD-789]AJH04447.1 helix-turn-helix family protein [Bacillus thuringiensis HD1002]RCX40003.1 putative transcriptional regulator [Bacillus sp. AG102]TWE74305.1 putative transcriptional regulator [Bacillus thuringiensis]TWG44698.1 putative transcriptional regulator [Bacillus sp. AK8]VIJ05675.1 Helix-turn-helix [Bacillus thuringiensis serovar israelensis]